MEWSEAGAAGLAHLGEARWRLQQQLLADKYEQEMKARAEIGCADRCVCVHTHVRARTHARTRTHASTRTRAHTHTYTNTHTHTHSHSLTHTHSLSILHLHTGQ